MGVALFGLEPANRRRWVELAGSCVPAFRAYAYPPSPTAAHSRGPRKVTVTLQPLE